MRIRAFILIGIIFFSIQSDAVTQLTQNNFGYIGQSRNQVVHLQAFGGYRFYNSETKQFLKRDGYSPFGGKALFNGYNYAVGNPILNLDRSGHISSACRLFLFAALLTGVACSTQMVEDWHRASEVSDQAVLLWWQARRQVILQSPSLERLLAEADQGENVVINSLRPLGRSIFKFFIWRFKLRYPERWLQQVAQARVFAKTEMALANPEGATAIKDFYQKSDQKIFRDIIGQDISNERFNAYVLSKGQGIPAEILEKNIVPFLIEG